MRRIAVLSGLAFLAAAPAADAGLHYLAGRMALATVGQALAGTDRLRARHVGIDPWRQTLVIDGLTFTAPGSSVSLSRLTYRPAHTWSFLIGSAVAQDKTAAGSAPPGTILAENIVIDSKDATYTIPHMEVSGGTLSQAELLSLFDAKNPTPIADRLAAVTAAKIDIPEVRMHVKAAPATGDVVYHAITLSNVAKGHVAEGRLGGLTANFATPDTGAIDASCGEGRVNDYDVVQNVRIMTETAKTPEDPKLLYSSLRIDNCKLEIAKTHTAIDIGSFSFTDVRGRPPQQPWNAAQDLFGHDPNEAEDPAVIDKRRNFLLDIYASQEVGAMEADNLRITTAQEGSPVSVSLGKVILSKFAASKIGEIRFDSLDVDAPSTKLKLATFAVRGMNLADLARLVAHKPDDATPILPIIDQLHVEGLDVDTADAKSDSKGAADAPAHTRFQLATFDVTGSTNADRIPTHFAMSLDHLTTSLALLAPADLVEVSSLGYDRLDLSARLTMSFDADKQELTVEDASLTGKDMGHVTLSGLFSNVSKDLFSQDETIAEAALLSALVSRVELRVENGGLFERFVAAEAKKEGKPLDEVRRDYVAAVSLGVPAMLDNGPGAKPIAAALAKFVAAPKNFHLVARAPDGLGASDFALIKQPGALMERLKVEATADE